MGVDVARDGEEALVRALAREYDVTLLGLVLRGVDGFDVCRQLREQRVWSPTLMLTARDGVDDRVRGLDSGADDYLVKPFAFGELLARLRALTRRVPADRPAALAVDGVELDPATHTVTRGGGRVELSPREFALLEYLMRHPGQVLSRTRLIEHVWDENYYGSTNVVDVYVGYLRRKLGRELIRTVRGAGY